MTPYAEALQWIKLHLGTGSSLGLAKLVLSLWNDSCGFSYRECVRSIKNTTNLRCASSSTSTRSAKMRSSSESSMMFAITTRTCGNSPRSRKTPSTSTRKHKKWNARAKSMSLIGYARVSTSAQDLKNQKTALDAAGCVGLLHKNGRQRERLRLIFGGVPCKPNNVFPVVITRTISRPKR